MKEYEYGKLADHYDILEEHPSIDAFNTILNSLLKKFKAKTVLDLTCGTGTQAAFLHSKGYHVTASDISTDMLRIARKKHHHMTFHQADMRTAQFGVFDTAISIFNAIGHLSKKDFEKALKNIRGNLKPHGLYIFDIFNLDFMKNNFMKHEFIDVAKETGGTTYVRFNKNTIDTRKGIMTINQKTYIQEGMNTPTIFKDSWNMQIYSSDQLQNILKKNGFEVIQFLDIDGKKFEKTQSLFILTIARKKSFVP